MHLIHLNLLSSSQAGNQFCTKLDNDPPCSTVLCGLCPPPVAVVFQHLALLATFVERRRCTCQAMCVPCPTEIPLRHALLMPGCTMSQQLHPTRACIPSPFCKETVVWILPATCADARRSAIGFIVASAIVLPWTLTFMIGEALFLFRSLLACRTVVAIGAASL